MSYWLCPEPKDLSLFQFLKRMYSYECGNHIHNVNKIEFSLCSYKFSEETR